MDVEESAAAIGKHWSGTPRAGIVLGTGLGDLAEQVDAEAVIDYADIPGFGKSTALAHKGRLICGTLAGVPVAVMQGRVHLYEGYSPQQVTLPVRVMKALGAELLIVTNANGGVNPKLATGDIVVMDDHINLMWISSAECGVPSAESSSAIRNPQSATRNCSRLPYDRELSDAALAIARREDFTAHRGVYAAMTGPSYETRAEYRMLRKLGADCVGMSTVPEVLAAMHVGPARAGIVDRHERRPPRHLRKGRRGRGTARCRRRGGERGEDHRGRAGGERGERSVARSAGTPNTHGGQLNRTAATPGRRWSGESAQAPERVADRRRG